MPSRSKKQKRFFAAVKRAKHDPSYGDSRLHKVAASMPDSSIDDFIKSIAELKVKKAVLSVLKDVREPSVTSLIDEGDNDIIVKEFNVEGKFEEYANRFLGQNLVEKEMEAVNTFQEVKPTKIERNQIRYETTDEFKNSTTTIIKKLKEGGQFVFVAFTKYSKAEKSGGEQQYGAGSSGMGGLGGSPLLETDQPRPSNDMSVPTNSDFASGTAPYESFKQKYVPKIEAQSYLNWPEKDPLNEQLPVDPLSPTPAGVPMNTTIGGPVAPGVGPLTTTAPMTGTPKSPEQRKKEMGIDDILVRKSTTYKNDIKGGAILAEFLKKLDL